MGLFDAFVALNDVTDNEQVKQTKKIKTLKESKEHIETINISGDDMYEKGQAYYYAHTGDKVDYNGQTYEIIVDKEGKHKIGYSDTLLLKNVETGEEIEVSKADFIKEATLLKESSVCEACSSKLVKLDESREDYWVLTDGNPNHAKVWAELTSEDVESIINQLEDNKKNMPKQGHWTLSHFLGGKESRIWDSEKGRLGEGCELKEEPTYDLGTQFDSRQSFYGKAKVDVRPDGSQVLYSYGSPVCQITKDGKPYLLVHVNGYASYASSQTTLRHVKEFLKQNGTSQNVAGATRRPGLRCLAIIFGSITMLMEQ